MLLKLLVHQHPHPLDVKVLYVLLDDLKYSISEEEFGSHIAYLVDKGYAKKDIRKTASIKIEMITITPDGIDLIDGFREDCGVDVRF
jgi:hypothetical protein